MDRSLPSKYMEDQKTFLFGFSRFDHLKSLGDASKSQHEIHQLKYWNRSTSFFRPLSILADALLFTMYLYGQEK